MYFILHFIEQIMFAHKTEGRWNLCKSTKNGQVLWSYNKMQTAVKIKLKQNLI